jgi:hypothetical protein
MRPHCPAANACSHPDHGADGRGDCYGDPCAYADPNGETNPDGDTNCHRDRYNYADGYAYFKPNGNTNRFDYPHENLDSNSDT